MRQFLLSPRIVVSSVVARRCSLQVHLVILDRQVPADYSMVLFTLGTKGRNLPTNCPTTAFSLAGSFSASHAESQLCKLFWSSLDKAEGLGWR
jgi:hypothetical protein